MFVFITVLIYFSPISVVSMYPVIEGFVENLEAIDYFEEVFDSAAVVAGAKVEEIDESNRRWDSGDSINGYQRDTRQADFSRNPSSGSRTIFRDDNEDLRINIRGNRRQRIRNQNRYQNSQFSELAYPKENGGRNKDFVGNRDRFNRLPERNSNNAGRFDSNENQIREEFLPSFSSSTRNTDSPRFQSNPSFGRTREGQLQTGQRVTPERPPRINNAVPTPTPTSNPAQHQQFSYNQFQTEGSYFQLSLIQNSTESTNPGNTQSTFYSLKQGTRPTNQGNSVPSQLGENPGIDVTNMDTEDKLMLEYMILNNLENMGNEEKSLMEDIVEMVKDNMGFNEHNMLENVLDKNMEFMNNDEKNLMEDLFTTAVEMMEDREIDTMENILEKDMNNLNIKEKVLIEDIIEDNVDKMTSMEIGLMNNILQKDLENMNNNEKTLMEDILRLEIMKNINERKPKEGNPPMQTIHMNVNEAAPLTLNLANPADSSIPNKALDPANSGKILYCQYCILPANSAGFVIN